MKEIAKNTALILFLLFSLWFSIACSFWMARHPRVNQSTCFTHFKMVLLFQECEELK